MKNVVLVGSKDKPLKLMAKASAVLLSRVAVMDVTAPVVKPRQEMVQANANANREIANAVQGARANNLMTF